MHDLRRRLVSAALAVGALAPVSAIGQSQDTSSVTSQAAPHKPTRGRITDHVVIISIDGLRADAVDKYKMETLERLMKEGRYSLSAQTIPLSFTLPSHTSMLTGVTPEKHGVIWNSDRAADLGFSRMPTIFQYAKNAGFNTAAFFSKAKFSALMTPGTIDYVVRQGDETNAPWTAEHAIEYVHEFLKNNGEANLLFVHIADGDMAGHSAGWMSRQYGDALQQADLAVDMVLSDLTTRFGQGNFTVIVSSDHGGHDRTHGTSSRLDMTIPWILWGEGVQPGDELKNIKTMDTAATALWLLGIEIPNTFDGHPVTSAFEAAAAKAR